MVLYTSLTKGRNNMFGKYVKVYKSPSNIVLSILVAIGRYYVFIYLSSLISYIFNLNFKGYDKYLIAIISVYLFIIRIFEKVYVKCDIEELSDNISIESAGPISYKLIVNRLPEGIVYLDKEDPLKRREFIVVRKTIYDIRNTDRSTELSNNDIVYILNRAGEGLNDE